MANTQSLGVVGFIPMGDYSQNTYYQKLSLVRYNYASYVAKMPSQGVIPTATTGWQDYWMLSSIDMGEEFTRQAQESATSAAQAASQAQGSATSAAQAASQAQGSATSAAQAASNSVHFNEAQTLTAKQQAQARANIGVYPINSIYLSVDSTSPASLFGGTWERIKDRFLLAAGDTYAAGASGGSASHNHGLNNGYATIELAPNGYIGIKTKTINGFTCDRFLYGTSGTIGGAWPVSEASALGGNTDNATNMPPYLTVYVWKRTA